MTTATAQTKRLLNTDQVIMRTAFRRIRRGAVIFALYAVIMITLQGFTLIKTYPTEAARQQFATTLTSDPSIGVLYGEPLKITTPAGYMIYRSLDGVALIGALWGLFAITKILRGQEEDGQWELLLSGDTTARQALYRAIQGCLLALALAYVVTTALLVFAGSSSQIGLSFGRSLLLGAAVVLPAACAMAVGAITSQLAITRRQAIVYGAIPLVALFILRSIANVDRNAAWLKNITPFGWIDRLHIVANAQPLWILVFLAVIVVCVWWAARLTAKRDLGASIIARPSIAKPHTRLLNRSWRFSLRLTRGSILGWLLGGVFIIALMAGLAKTAGKAAGSSHSLTKALHTIAGNTEQSISLLFVGYGMLLLALILMALVITTLQAARNEEARGHLDELLAQPLTRVRWLTGRALLIALSLAVIIELAALTAWYTATQQGIHVGLGTLLGNSLSLLGPLLLLLGFGMLVYGLRPRIMTTLMYGFVGWSLLIDLISSSASMNKVVVATSLFHYVAFVPAAKPDWTTTLITAIIGIGAGIVGTIAFHYRDLESE